LKLIFFLKLQRYTVQDYSFKENH